MSLDSSTARAAWTHHEAGGVVLARHPGDLLLQLGGPVDLDRGAALVGHRGVRPVGGQLEALGQAGQACLPVASWRRSGCRRRRGRRAGRAATACSRRTAPAVAPSRGPDPRIGWHRPARDRPPADAATIRRRRCGAPRRPAGARRRRAEELGPQRDLRGQVEGVLRRRTGGLVQPVRRPTRGIDRRPSRSDGRRRVRPPAGVCRPSPRTRCAGSRGGPPRRPVPRAARRRRPAPQPQRHRHVVNRRRALQLVDEPQPVLGERQRNRRRAARLRTSGSRRAAALADPRRQLGDGGRLEHRAHRKVDVQCGVDRGDQAHRRQGVAAEVEERVVHADPVDAEQLRVDGGQTSPRPRRTGRGNARRPGSPVRAARGCRACR